MNLERFLAERADNWSELDALVRQAHGQVGRLGPEGIRRLGEQYRMAASDLALARRLFPYAAGTQRLQGLVVSAHALVYARAGRTETAWEFVSRGLWQRLWENGRCLVLSASVLVGFVILGTLWALYDPASAIGLLPSGAHVSLHSRGAFYGISVPARAGLGVAIFVNNIEVSLLAIGGGFTFGILTVFSLGYNGALIGVLGALEWRAGGFDQFLRLVVPHGLLELSCIALAGAGGLAIARALIDPGRLTRTAALGRMVPQLGATVLGVVLFLIVAGMTEGIVTPWDLPTAAALAVGITLAGSFWALVFWRGAPRSPGGRRVVGSSATRSAANPARDGLAA
jgi:uncharacterized membrane protein SpoIIM required for sporulation